MARNKKLINNAENHMIVGSLEVIGDISGSGMKEIKRSVTTLQESVSAYVGKTKDYWKELSDDGVITPFEKTLLKKEYESIASSYAAIMHEAVSQQVTDTSAIIAYQAAYNSLRYYINTVLGLFDEMGNNTEIPDRDVFNNYYSTYYSTENFVQVALAVGQIGSLDFTVVDNLNFEGTDDQVVIYKGEIYQWVHDHWKKVGTDGYCGCISYLPSGVAGNFFLAASDFVANIYLLNVDGKTLVSPEGDILCTNQSFNRAFIYEYVNGHWNKVTDTDDYRYIVAMSDYYNLTGRLPSIWQDTIDDLQEEIENVHIPKYLGMINVTSNIPASTGSGDWFLWTGSQTTTGGVTYKNLYIYRDTKSESSSAWQELNPADTTYSSYYMSCLNDVLNQTAVIGSETFDVIFANAFFANSASINALKTKTIELTGDEGVIKSEDYNAGSDDPGFCIRADGKAFFKQGTFTGIVNATSGSFTGSVTASSGTFYGDIKSGPFFVSNDDPSSESYTIDLYDDAGVINTYELFMWCINNGYPLFSNWHNKSGTITNGYIPASFNGTINDVAFRRIFYRSPGYAVGIFRFETNDGTVIGTYTYDPYSSTYNSLPVIILDQYTPGKTFKLLYLPTSPGVAGSVYRDSENYLRISPYV